MNYSKGDILVPKGKQYPDGAIVVVGHDETGRLLAHPLGGGLQLAIPQDATARFRLADKLERGRALFRRAKFSLMDSEELFTGWTDGQAWNGWAKPHFELAEARRLLVWFRDDKARFDADRDAFVTVSQDGEEEFWEGRAIAISDGSSIKVYPVGAGCWCWDEIEEAV